MAGKGAIIHEIGGVIVFLFLRRFGDGWGGGRCGCRCWRWRLGARERAVINKISRIVVFLFLRHFGDRWSGGRCRGRCRCGSRRRGRRRWGHHRGFCDRFLDYWLFRDWLFHSGRRNNDRWLNNGFLDNRLLDHGGLHNRWSGGLNHGRFNHWCFCPRERAVIHEIGRIVVFLLNGVLYDRGLKRGLFGDNDRWVGRRLDLTIQRRHRARDLEVVHHPKRAGPKGIAEL